MTDDPPPSNIHTEFLWQQGLGPKPAPRLKPLPNHPLIWLSYGFQGVFLALTWMADRAQDARWWCIRRVTG